MDEQEFFECPRCAFMSYVRTKVHSFCVNCLYSPITDREVSYAVPSWAWKAFLKFEREEKEKREKEVCGDG